MKNTIAPLPAVHAGPRRDNLYVADARKACSRELSARGSLLPEWGHRGDDGQLTAPCCLTADAKGSV